MQPTATNGTTNPFACGCRETVGELFGDGLNALFLGEHSAVGVTSIAHTQKKQNPGVVIALVTTFITRGGISRPKTAHTA